MELVSCLITKKNLMDVAQMIGQKTEQFPVIINDYTFIAGVTTDGTIELIVQKQVQMPQQPQIDPMVGVNVNGLTPEQAKLQLINAGMQQKAAATGGGDELHVFHIKGNDVTIIQ